MVCRNFRVLRTAYDDDDDDGDDDDADDYGDDHEDDDGLALVHCPGI